MNPHPKKGQKFIFQHSRNHHNAPRRIGDEHAEFMADWAAACDSGSSIDHCDYEGLELYRDGHQINISHHWSAERVDLDATGVWYLSP